MTQYVADASVIAVSLLEEADCETARRFIEKNAPLLVPDMVYPEFVNVLWKQHSRGRISRASADQLLDQFLRIPLRVISSAQLLPQALELAIQTKRTVYDCLYLALAIESDATLVTADQRFANAISSTPYSGRIVLLEHLRESR